MEKPATVQSPVANSSVTQPPADPFLRLRKERAGLRSDLHISRHLHRGEAVYLLHDPISFQTHRLSVEDYTAAIELHQNATLQECFEAGVAAERLPNDERDFYTFVMQLHRLGLLTLPLHNGTELFKRQEQMKSGRKKNRWLSWMCISVPLTNPDSFLTRTAPFMRFLFTPWFGVLWILAAAATGYVVISRIREFAEPMNGLLAGHNWLFLWLALVLLKVWHELGHGYACKIFGGRVPEMGAMLMMGTPAAYCDTSAAWSFGRKSHRLMVMLGGMYFESLLAIPAVFVWALAGNSFLGSCAFQIVFMASVVTVFFNANPLMKYDGYFIAAELLGVQNLQSKAAHECKLVLRRIFLGLESPPHPHMGMLLRGTLLLYGSLASIYKLSVSLGIAVMLARSFWLIGITFALIHVSSFAGGLLTRLGRYLLLSEDAKKAPLCCAFWCCCLVGGVPATLYFAPVPFGVIGEGVTGAEQEQIVRVNTPGTLNDWYAKQGDAVSEHQPLLQLCNSDVAGALQVQTAQNDSLRIRFNLERERDLTKSAKTESELVSCEKQLTDVRHNHDELCVRSPLAGRLVSLVSPSQQDRFFKPGEPVATVVSGKRLVKVWLNEEQLRAIHAKIDSSVRCRFPGTSVNTFHGRLVNIQPASIETLTDSVVTQLGGGSLLIDPQTGRPIETLFELHVELDAQLADILPHGSRASVCFARAGESLLAFAIRQGRNFFIKLSRV